MAIQTFTSGQVLTAAQVTALQTNDYNQTVSTKTGSYTLVASDVGTRVVMNSASSTTITVNTSLFSAGDTLFIQNIGAGTCTVTAGTATVTTSSSLALAQWGGGTLYFTSASAAIFFSVKGTGYGVATGGASSSISDAGFSWTLLTFTADNNLVVSTTGLFDILLVGGGGRGGNYSSNGGGGGAGGYLVQTVYLTAATYAVKVGAGSATNNQLGLPSYIGSTGNGFAVAGGGDGATVGYTAYGNSGASGGGGFAATAGGVGQAPQGFSGSSSGGGGGSSAAATSGSGGAGTTATFSGSSVTRAAGGNNTGGAAGAANTGNGGQGSTTSGGNGGSGLVLVRFR